MLGPLELLILLLRDLFSYLVLGALILHFRIIKASFVAWFMKKVVVNVFFPLLIFQNTLLNLTQEQIQSSYSMVLLACAFIFLSFFLMLLFSRLTTYTINKNSFILSGTFHNYGFTVIPLVSNLLGEKALPLAFTFILSCEALFWSLGTFILAKNKGRISIKQILSAPFVTLVISFLWVYLGYHGIVPNSFLKLLSYPTKLTIPLALTCIGGIFYASIVLEAGEQKKTIKESLREYLKPVIAVLSFRHLFMPGLLILLISFLSLNKEQSTISQIEAVMPASVGIVFLANLYGGSVRYLAIYSTLSNLISIISIVVWLQLAL